jgi:hypothetical protein
MPPCRTGGAKAAGAGDGFRYPGTAPGAVTARHHVLAPLAAVALATVVGAATGTPAILALTPSGAAVYLLVGLALPALVDWRDGGDDAALGLAALAATAAVVVLALGAVGAAPDGPWLVGILLVLVVGALGGAAVRSFRAGRAAGRRHR